MYFCFFFFFFFSSRRRHTRCETVTGVPTCALPIWPENEHWMFRAGVRGPDGELVPLLAMSQESGAQLVVQSADGITDLRLLARMLMQNLSVEQRVHVDDVEKLRAR